VGAQTTMVESALDDRVRRGNAQLGSSLRWLVVGTLASAIALMSVFIWLRRALRQREQALAAQLRSHQSVERQVIARTSDLLAANSALRAGEAFLRSIGDHLPGGVIYQLVMESGRKPRFLHVSAGIERINGVTAQALLDDSDAFFDQIVEEDRPAWLAARTQANRELRAFSVDARIRRPDGELRWCHYTASPRRLPDGRVLWDGIALDITERKTVEAEREQLLERLSDAFFSLDAQGRFTYVNLRAAEILARPRAALIGRCIWSEFPTFGKTPFYAACLRALAEQRFELSQDYNPANDRWFESRIYPSRDGVSVFASDVTESRRAERALRESETRLRLALEASNIGLWEWKFGSSEAYYSPVLKRHMGYEDHEVADRADTWEQYIHPDDLPAARARLAATARPPWPKYENEYRLRHKDGSYFWIRATGAMVLDADGKPLRLIGTQQDISAVRQAQAERERLLSEQLAARAEADAAHQRVAHVLESVSDGFVALDREWRYVYVNEQAAQTFGRTSDALIGKHIWTEFPEGVGQPFQRAYQKAMNEQTFIFLEEYYPPSDRWFENRIYPSPDGISIFFHDISDRKRAEAALRTTEAQLHELLAQLQRAQETERIRISRQIHDELGQLLTGVKMDLRWLERKLGEPGAPREFNALLDRTVAASALNDQLIATVQRIAAELRPSALDQLGLPAALTQAGRRFQERSGVVCVVDVAGFEADLPAAVAGELFYICQEALTNVARHAQASKVEIELREHDGRTQLEVRDDGVGIHPALIDGRHSLGLLGMRERALHCGGVLQVQRREPRGTRVSVQVPLGATAEAALP
jgi:PAS domain S-box-containing protein